MNRERTRARGGWLVAFAAGAIVLLAPGAHAAGPAHRGVTVHGLLDDDFVATERQLDEADRLGSNVVRVSVLWAAYEPSRQGRYDPVYSERTDRFMRALSARGMKALATIHQTPCWGTAAAPNCGSLSATSTRPPRDARDYGRFVRFFARRYREQLAAIEVWNEPNHGSFFQAQDRPLAYSKLVKAAYPEVKAVAPHVKVLAGATSGSDAEFLRGLYHYGIRGSYDAIAIHPYTGDGSWSPDHIAPAQFDESSFVQGVRLVRRTQRAAGDDTPIWLTEFGWNTGAYRDMTLTPYLNGVDEPTQARYLSRALAMLNGKEFAFVQGATIYTLRDTLPTSTTLSDYGLLRYDLSRKPSYAAVTRSFAAISRAQQEARVRALGRRR